MIGGPENYTHAGRALYSMKDESQKYISIIFKEWLPLYDSLTPEVRAVLKNIAGAAGGGVSDPFL